MDNSVQGPYSVSKQVLIKSSSITLPLLILLGSTAGFEGGTGTSSDPYQISTCQQLQDMNNDLDAYYELIEDIDCSQTEEWNYGSGFVPIGDRPDYGDRSQEPFNGSLDGQNFEIEDLFIARGSENNVGLFGYWDEGAVVKNIGLSNISVSGEDRTGGLVGYTVRGDVFSSYATGSVSGSEYTGGLVGYNSYGNVVSSYARVDVSSNKQYTGGLVGFAWGYVVSSYATGDVYGGIDTGGLAGFNGRDVISSYATGDVTGEDRTGGLIGRNQDSVVSSYWDIESSGTSTGIGADPDDGVTGLTTSEMQGSSAEINMPGLDFSGNWSTVENNYPILQWQNSGDNVDSIISICDQRGPFNECISDSSHDVSSKSYSISSIFQVENTAVFQALDGVASISVDNSTVLSGVWRGSFDISTLGQESTVIKSGARFEPENGRIIID